MGKISEINHTPLHHNFIKSINHSLDWVLEIEGRMENDKIQCYFCNANNNYTSFLQVKKSQLIGKNINEIEDDFIGIYYQILHWFVVNTEEDSLTVYVNKKGNELKFVCLGDLKDEQYELKGCIAYVQSRTPHSLRVSILVKDINKEVNYIKERFMISDINNYNDIIMNLSDVVSNLSHSWRQPLNSLNFSVINFIDELDEEEDFNRAKEEFYKEIWHIIKSLSREIEKFKAFFEMDYKKDIFDVNKYLDLVFEILEEKIIKENIVINTYINEKIHKYGPPKEFLQIMYCILFDIIEHCKETFDINNRIIKVEVTRKENIVILEIEIQYDKKLYPNYKLNITHLTMFQNIVKKMEGTIDLINEDRTHKLVIGFPLGI